jgi:hypothetical protein
LPSTEPGSRGAPQSQQDSFDADHLPQIRPIEFEEHDVNFHIGRANGQCDRSDGDEVLPVPISWPPSPLHAIARIA